MTTTIQKEVDRNPRLTGEWWHEGPDGYWIVIAPGFICQATETHTIHECTVKECLAAIKTIVPCECRDCREEQQ